MSYIDDDTSCLIDLINGSYAKKIKKPERKTTPGDAVKRFDKVIDKLIDNPENKHINDFIDKPIDKYIDKPLDKLLDKNIDVGSQYENATHPTHRIISFKPKSASTLSVVIEQ
jgi:hypothetical protein